jgi:hypothetical protein
MLNLQRLPILTHLNHRLREADSMIRLLLPHFLQFSRGTRHVCQPPSMEKTRTMTKMKTVRYKREAALLHFRRGVRRHVCQLLLLEAESILPPPRRFLILCLSPVLRPCKIDAMLSLLRPLILSCATKGHTSPGFNWIADQLP